MCDPLWEYVCFLMAIKIRTVLYSAANDPVGKLGMASMEFVPRVEVSIFYHKLKQVITNYVLYR